MAKLNLSVQDDTEESELKYRAPALEKGLDIVELLAASPKPMPPRQISEQLNRSVSELFRMIAVLEHRGYVAMAENQSGYELTNKLFSLGMSRGVSKNLLDYAIPAIRALSDEILQATHIVVASDDQVVVIGQMDAPAAPSCGPQSPKANGPVLNSTPYVPGKTAFSSHKAPIRRALPISPVRSSMIAVWLPPSPYRTSAAS
jgi:hypothetical protein